MNKRTVVGVAVAGVATLALLVWAFAPRPLEVEVAQATPGPFETTIDEDARTRLRDRYLVSAPLAGRLARMALREGDAVEADAVVATLTPVLPTLLDERTRGELAVRVEAAEAGVQRAAARVERARVGLEQARNDLRRSEQLAQQGFVAPTKLDSDRLGVLAAQKEVDAAEQDRHVAGHDVEQARAALEVVGRGAAHQAAFVVRAPVAGRVLRVVQPSEGTVALGAPLLEIGDTARLEVVAELLTTDALQTRPGAPVRIERWGGPTVLEGRVRRIEPAAFTKVSALGVEEQRVNVLIDITSPAALWTALGDGFRVGVRVVTRSEEHALRVPVSAVFPLPEGGLAVFRVDAGRARRVPVQVGARNGSEAWVTRGLDAGATVVVYPPAALADGMRVAPRKV